MRLDALSCRGPETVKISLAVVCVPGRVSLCVCVCVCVCVCMRERPKCRLSTRVSSIMMFRINFIKRNTGHSVPPTLLQCMEWELDCLLLP